MYNIKIFKTAIRRYRTIYQFRVKKFGKIQLVDHSKSKIIKKKRVKGKNKCIYYVLIDQLLHILT